MILYVKYKKLTNDYNNNLTSRYYGFIQRDSVRLGQDLLKCNKNSYPTNTIHCVYVHIYLYIQTKM